MATVDFGDAAKYLYTSVTNAGTTSTGTDWSDTGALNDMMDQRIKHYQQEQVSDRLRQELESMKYEKQKEEVKVNRLGDDCFWANRNATKFEEPLDELRLKVHNWLNPN